MQATLTSEQLLSLATDKYALRTARAWSAREKWLRIGQDQGSVWGEFKGKSKKPIQTMVSLQNPLFSCTCTGRKLPCSHAIGLRLLYFESPHLFRLSVPSVSSQSASSDSASSEPATSSGEWHASLIVPSSTGSSILAPATDNIILEGPIAETSSDHLDSARLQRICRGLNELDLWFGDVVRNGLESVRDKKRAADWQRMARRLVDAQASELALKVRKLATIPGSTPQWPEELLAQMGKLHLLIEGFRNFEDLPLEVQGDLRLAVGWLPKAEPTSATTLTDRWHVLARQPINIGKQRRHKIWLWGEESNRPALVVQILTNKQKQIESVLPGTVLAGSLYFYPSLSPLRAEIIKAEVIDADAQSQSEGQSGNPTAVHLEQPSKPVDGYANLDEAFRSINQMATQNPWVDEFPILIRSGMVENAPRAKQNTSHFELTGKFPNLRMNRTTTTHQYSWYLTDETGIRLPLPNKFEYGWHLKALSQTGATSTRGVCLFGVWDRTTFMPTTVWQDGRWLSLHILKGEL